MHSHKPRKRFGQHFLHDPEVLYQIIKHIAPNANDHMVEIGPGQGVLTRLIAPHVKQLDVIEIDRDLITYLQKQYAHLSNLHIHGGDVLKFQFELLSTTPQSLRVVGNLPYNISSPVLFKLFSLSNIKDMHFMLQREVVHRLAAKTGDKHYNRLSVMAQYYCEPINLFEISPKSFKPPPKVHSAFIRLIPRPCSIVANNIDTLSIVVREAFSHRRKTLANCLKKIIPTTTLLKLNIDPSLRPQQISVEDFVKISNIIKS